MARIIELAIENFRRIRAIEIRPDGSLVVISGANGSGKTSILHAIWTVLKGRAVAGPTPIRKGAEQCIIRCQTDEFTVTRTFKGGADGEITTDLKVVMKDGRRIERKPQAMLDAILPDLALDPLAFMRRGAREQVDTLKAMVKGFDFQANQGSRQNAYEARTLANRLHGNAVAAAEAIALPAGPEPARIDTTALAQEIASAMSRNVEIDVRARRREEAQRDIDAKLDEAEALRARAATLERDAKALQDKLAGAEALPERVNIAALSDRMASATGVNAVVERFEQRRRHQVEAEKHAAEATRLTREIETLDQSKRGAITAAKLPVDGLEFDDDGIQLGGVPFEQASMAEKLRASVGIGMALLPAVAEQALRVMTVDEGSELDPNSLALLAELADTHGYQIWVARVQQGEQGFLIQDGMLQEAQS